MIEYKAKKLFNGHVSVRDYIVNKAIRSRKYLRIQFEGEYMTLTTEKLKESVNTFHKQEFKSAFNNKTYTLYDFVWRPDGSEEEEKGEEVFNDEQLELFKLF
tara:strand:+ start:288 stop:593 length:306 start_codon:yes stop_codon:yes gene_type:complete